MAAGALMFIMVMCVIITFMFTRTTSVIKDPDVGESILFSGQYNVSTQTSTWTLFPGISVSKTEVLNATSGQKVQIICPLVNGSQPWQILPMIFNVDSTQCVTRVQVDL